MMYGREYEASATQVFSEEPMRPPAREVAILDPDEAMRELARLNLKRDGRNVSDCPGCVDGNSCKVGRCILSGGVDLAIIGCQEPGRDEGKLVERIRGRAPQARVFVTSEGLPWVRIEVLQEFRQMGAELALRSFPLLREIANNPGMSANGQVYLEEREEHDTIHSRIIPTINPTEVERVIAEFRSRSLVVH